MSESILKIENKIRQKLINTFDLESNLTTPQIIHISMIRDKSLIPILSQVNLLLEAQDEQDDFTYESLVELNQRL